MVAAMFTITAMTMGSFSGARVRRRMYASPQRTGSMLFQQFACCGLFGVLVSLFYLALALALPVAAGLPITGVDPRGFLLCALTMVAYSLTAAASGFMVGMRAVNNAAISAIADVSGLVIMFTSGMAFPVDLMPKVMIVIGKCTPGWWFCRSISAAMNSEGTVSVSNWFPGIALVLLFGVAFIALGLALSQMRRLRPNLAAPASTQLAEV